MSIPDIIKWGAAGCVAVFVCCAVGWLVLRTLQAKGGDGQ